MIDWDNDSINGGEAEDNMIELMDIVFDAPDSGTTDDIIELTEIVKKQEMNIDLDSIEMESSREKEDADQNRCHDFTASVDLTSEQIEAALEKVIEKQFAGKIQTILFQVMEKVIEREITGIRESLQKDLDQIGNV
jgi:fumarylacetoacetate (FAA) hydrolase family protein